MIDHCVAAYRQENERMLTLVYVTDGLKLLNDNVVHAIGGNTLNMRYFDLISGQTEPEETRSSDDIINSIKEKLRQMGGEE